MKTKLLLIISVSCVIGVGLFFVLTSNENPANWYLGNIRISENDKFCYVTLTVHHVSLSPFELEQFVRGEIAKLGSQYDFPERWVESKQVDPDTISISIRGDWRTSDSDGHPNLLNIFSTLKEVEVEDKVLSICA